MSRFLHRALFGLDLFLAVTTIGGGVGLLTGLIAPSRDLLAGSIFSSYLIPGLALLVLVGGSAALASAEAGRRGVYAAERSIVAGAMIVVYELVEWTVIGYHVLQAFYLGVGGVIIVLAYGLLFAPASQPRRTIHGRLHPGHRPGRHPHLPA